MKNFNIFQIGGNYLNLPEDCKTQLENKNFHSYLSYKFFIKNLKFVIYLKGSQICLHQLKYLLLMWNGLELKQKQLSTKLIVIYVDIQTTLAWRYCWKGIIFSRKKSESISSVHLSLASSVLLLTSRAKLENWHWEPWAGHLIMYYALDICILMSIAHAI